MAAPIDPLLQDPLSDVTRKERRMLLGVSMLGVALVKTGLVPTKIAALGVEFDKTNQQALLGVLALITLYFVVAFLLYASSDFLAWAGAIRSRRWNALIEEQKDRREVGHEKIKERPYGTLPLTLPVSMARAGFEFLLPIGVGVYATQLLWFAGGRI